MREETDRRGKGADTDDSCEEIGNMKEMRRTLRRRERVGMTFQIRKPSEAGVDESWYSP